RPALTGRARGKGRAARRGSAGRERHRGDGDPTSKVSFASASPLERVRFEPSVSLPPFPFRAGPSQRGLELYRILAGDPYWRLACYDLPSHPLQGGCGYGQRDAVVVQEWEVDRWIR